MNKTARFLTLAAFAFSLSALGEVSEVAQELLKKVQPGTITLQEDNGWLYSKNELEHLSAGELAQGKVKEHSKSSKAENADPIAALSDFNRQLKAAGIRLLVVPVPPKAAIVPPAGLQKGEAMVYLKPFYNELKSQDIEVLDLSERFLAGGADVYCRQDAHWSPAGIQLAAAEIAKTLAIAKGNETFPWNTREISIVGDLMASLDKTAKPSETLQIREVEKPVLSERSPVLVIGDSHALIFSTGKDMLAENAGIAEQLAVELAMPVDRIAVKGSAASAVRVNLFRKAAKNPQWLTEKKVVIYCFTCREFTESSSGWAKVPVFKQ